MGFSLLEEASSGPGQPQQPQHSTQPHHPLLRLRVEGARRALLLLLLVVLVALLHALVG